MPMLEKSIWLNLPVIAEFQTNHIGGGSQTTLLSLPAARWAQRTAKIQQI